MALVIASGVAQAAALNLPGTGDVRVFAVWMDFTAAHSPTSVYGVGGSSPQLQVMSFDGTESAAVYPPVGIYALAATGRLWRATIGPLRDHAAARIPIKLLVLAATLSLSLLLWIVARRSGYSAWIAAAGFWANPAVILNGAVLGYFDSLAALPTVAALVAASRGSAWLAGSLLAVGVLTKPQAVLVLPAIVLALVYRDDEARRRVWQALAGASIAGIAILAPFAAAGTLPNLIFSVSGLLADGWLSAQAANIWWLVGALFTDAQPWNIRALAEPFGAIRGRSIVFLAVLSLSCLSVLGVAAWATRRAARGNSAPVQFALGRSSFMRTSPWPCKRTRTIFILRSRSWPWPLRCRTSIDSFSWPSVLWPHSI